MHKTFYCFFIILTLSIFAADEKDIEVVAEGYGLSEEKALNVAFSSAIRQAVGMYVSAEELVSKETVIKDEILTYSDAIVKGYEVITKSKDADGLHTVSIKATVVRRKLIEKLGKAKITTADINMKGLFAKVASDKIAKKDVASIIKKGFDNYPGDIIVLEPSGSEPKMLKKGEKSHLVQIEHVLKVDQDKYKIFAQKLCSILDQITKVPSKALVTSMKQESKSQSEQEALYKNLTRSQEGGGQTNDPKELVETELYFDSSFMNDLPKGYNVAVAEKVFQGGKSIKWKLYGVDDEAIDQCFLSVQVDSTLNTSFTGEAGEDVYIANKSIGASHHATKLNLALGYDGGRLTSTDSLSTKATGFWAKRRRKKGIPLQFVICPFVHNLTSYPIKVHDKVRYFYAYSLSNETLNKTRKIKLELKFTPTPKKK